MKRRYILIIIVLLFLTNRVHATSKETIFTFDGSEKNINLAVLKSGEYKKIIIRNANLKVIPKEIFLNKKLTYLDLSNNNIKYINTDFNKLHELKTLVIRNNQIKQIDNKVELKKVSYIDLSGNNLTNIKNLDKHPNVEHLDLSYNVITYIGGLDQLKKLKLVYLNNNQLINLDRLPSKIIDINLDNNYLKKACCKKYKKAVKNQNKMLVKEGITLNQINYVMKNNDYVKWLIISSNSKSVVGFDSYKLKLVVEGNVYTIEDFLKKYKDGSGFSIMVEVTNSNGEKNIVPGNEEYYYNQDSYQSSQNQSASNVGIIDTTSDFDEDEDKDNAKNNAIVVSNFVNYFGSNEFKILSYLVYLVFLIPLTIILGMFIYINRMYSDIDKELAN